MALRRALLVGVEQYPNGILPGCVVDAQNLERLLKVNEDGSPNFACKVLTFPPLDATRDVLLRQLFELFRDGAEVVLFAFSGHGYLDKRGGYLVLPDHKEHDYGISMADVLALANKSRAKEVFVLLDCCHAGAFGEPPALIVELALLREGISILAATDRRDVAVGDRRGGRFTSLICDGLEGGAADTLGKVTAANLFAYVDEVFGPWDQRPNFKSNVSNFTPLRRCKPKAPLEGIRNLALWFPSPDHEFALSPEYEASDERAQGDKVKVLDSFRRLRDVGILVPVTHVHLFDAAKESGKCRLTALGKYYWRLAKEERV